MIKKPIPNSIFLKYNRNPSELNKMKIYSFDIKVNKVKQTPCVINIL